MCNFFKRTKKNNKAKIHNNTVRRRTHQYRRVKDQFNVERKTKKNRNSQRKKEENSIITKQLNYDRPESVNVLLLSDTEKRNKLAYSLLLYHRDIETLLCMLMHIAAR